MSLFDIEIKSHWLKEQLGKPHSTRLRLLYLFDFLSRLIGSVNPNKYISYYNEFAPELVKQILKNEFQFFSPSEIESLLYILKSLKSLAISIEGVEECIDILQNALKDVFTLLNETVEQKDTSHKNSINVVLIETNSDENKNVGTIQSFTLRSSKQRKEFFEDNVEFENLSENDHEKQESYIANIVSFSKDKVKEVISKPGTYNLTFSLGNKGCYYTGSSFGLALLALTYNSILVNELHRIYYSFYDDVVITGAIDENGNLLKLDFPTLKVKIETVFFSRFKKLIIPEDNIVEAKELLNVLQKNYPGRKLELIPLAGYKSLFQNLDIVEVRELKFKDKLKANYGRYHSIANTVFSIIILIILIVIAAKFLIPLLDRNPIRFGIQGDRYVAYNEYGKSIWESKILSEQDIGIFNNVEREKRIILSDLDNDGYNDILLLLSDEKNKILNRTLFCYNHDGNLKWKTVVPKHDSLYGNDYCPDDILIAMMSVINSNKGKEIIINYRICLMFPNFTMKISSKGKIISEFYNPGSIDKIVNYDIDNDGKDELFFSGINNDFDKSGTLMLFDSEYLSGCAPGYRFPQNCSKGLMKYYILFPKTGVGKFTTNGSSYARLVELTSERIVVIIREIDGYTDLKNKRHYQEYITLYTLDGSLNVLNVETSSEFDAKYQMLVNEGKLKPIENWKEFKAKLKNNVQWWDGDRFVNHPVMNKYYQKVISQKTAIN